MSQTVISVENLSKSYRLGQIGTGTLSRDLEVWLAKLRGKPNPLLRIGEKDHGNQDGETLWALKDVSFQVQQGEVLGIIGRNGAGKSTLLKILSRVTAPTSGVIKVKGRIASLLEVGTGFHPELTGRENIYLNGAILGMTKQEITRKFDEIVAFAEIEKFIDTPVKRYSSGMYVRLAFAVAAHLESEILLVDEVLAVGDAEFQKKCLGKMGDVASKEGRTVLFVSHNMGAIKQICNSGIEIKGGVIVNSGDIDSIISEYFSNTSKAESFVDLTNHRGRDINSKQVMVSCELYTGCKSSAEFYTNGEFKAKVIFEANQNVTKKASLGIDIRNRFGDTLFASNMFQHKVSIIIEPQQSVYEVLIEITKLNLTPGLYSLSLYWGNGSYDIDIIRNAIYFNVIWNNKLGLAFPPDSRWGPIYMESKWKSQLL